MPPHAVRRIGGAPRARPVSRFARPRKLGHAGGRVQRHLRGYRQAQRHYNRHGPNWLRQDHDALFLPAQDQQRREQAPHGRGACRIRHRRHRAGSNQPDTGQHVPARAARVPSPGPRYHNGRRNPRPRDGADRHPGVAHRPPRFLDTPHKRRRRRHNPSGGHGRGTLSDRFDPRGGSRAAPSAHDMQVLQNRIRAHAGHPTAPRSYTRAGAGEAV